MKLCSKTHQIAPFNNGMQLAQTTQKLIPLANPAYAHGKSWGSNP